MAQLFDVSYGMFLLDDETRTFRFNPDSLDSPMEFELIGAVLGIAIYNATIIGEHACCDARAERGCARALDAELTVTCPCALCVQTCICPA